MFDDFDTQIQSDELWDDSAYWQYAEEQYSAEEEINPAEYDDWMAYVYANQVT